MPFPDDFSIEVQQDQTTAPVLPPEFQPPVPRPWPVWSGWDVLNIAFLMFFSPFLLFFAVGAIAQRFFYHGYSWTQLAETPLLALVTEMLVYIPVLLFMVMLVEGKYHVRFAEAIEWRWPAHYFGLLALGVLTLFGLQGLAHFLPIPKNVPFDQFFKRPLEAYLTSAFAITLGPLMEELFFRGFLYPVIARRIGIVWGILITALGFGLLHAMQLGFAWGPVLIIFLVGLVLTIVRVVTKSVASSFIVHVAYNGTLTILTAIATGGFRHMERLTQ
jgi:membrane protease YdiL (CAAX protease family)